MPLIGFKKQFKNIKTLSNDIFTINFDLKYTEIGALRINDKNDSYFDVGDFRLHIDQVFNDFTNEILKSYDIGVYILSICKYIVDSIPNLYSITYESSGMIDTYYKNEIIEDYNKIKEHKDGDTK